MQDCRTGVHVFSACNNCNNIKLNTISDGNNPTRPILISQMYWIFILQEKYRKLKLMSTLNTLNDLLFDHSPMSYRNSCQLEIQCQRESTTKV